MIYKVEGSELVGGDVIIIEDDDDLEEARKYGLPIFKLEELDGLSGTPSAIRSGYELKRIFGEVWLSEERSELFLKDTAFQEAIMPILRGRVQA